MKKLKLAAILIASSLMFNPVNLFAAAHSANEGVVQNILVEPVNNLSEDFMRGVDISSLYEIEKNGGKFYNAQGQEEDLIKILKDNGVNWVRLRLWNNPTSGGGSNNIKVDVDLAKRVKAAGLKLMIDFHYSDSWADPGKQPMPKEWVGLNEKQLCAAVEKFTKESIDAFIKAGARPDAVQIGNELNNGFMWPIGKIWGDANETVGGFKSFTALLKSASNGVRAAEAGGEKIKIIIHLADGGKNDLYRAVFDPITQAKIDYDIIGLSFYTYWHGSISDLKKNMTDLGKRYGKEMAVMETAYAFTKDDGDDQGNVFMVYSGDNDGYIPSVQGQATAIRDVISTVASVKGGVGVFYWEPAWIITEGAGLSTTEGNTWENQNMFDFEGKALPSLAVWNLVYGNDRGAVKNIWGGSAKNGSGFVPYDLADPIKITTMPGVDPILPKMIKVVYTNDKENNVIASWEKHDWAAEKTPRTMTIQASLSGSDFKVPAEIEISSRVNLMEDNSFESGKLGKWKLNGSDTACFVENNKSNSHTGKWTYKYWLGTGFKSVLTQDFKNIENGTYVVTLWAMGGGGENDIRLLAANYDGTKTQISTHIENTGWLNWKKYRIEVPVTKNQITIGIYLDTNAGNWGNFDDVEFFLKDKDEGEVTWEDTFRVDLNQDMLSAVSDTPAVAADGPVGKMANVLQGIWIEGTSHTNAIIRDIAEGTKSGYEVDNNHFKSNANWWLWGAINKTFFLDAEIGVWNFDRTMYQANSFGANVPTVTWGDGLQGLGAMLFSPIYQWNDNGIGAFNKLGFTVSSPIVKVKFGYGNIKENGMSEFTGIYNVLDRWLDVGKGFTEISNGPKLQKFGDFKLNALFAFSQMRGTYGMYDILDLKYGENYRAVVTFGSKSGAEELFYYNQDNLNSVSAYLSAEPLNHIKLEAHVLGTFGTGVDFNGDSLAYAGRVIYSGDSMEIKAKGSYAAENVNSVWGSDGQDYDDINADTLTGRLDWSLNLKDVVTLGLDETVTLNDVSDITSGLMTIRTQPVIDVDLENVIEKPLTIGLYGVVNMDRLAKETSINREFITSFDSAGIEVAAGDMGVYLRKLTADYAVKFEYEDWKTGNSYNRTLFYNSLMFNADITDNFNVHLGGLYRIKTEKDETFVPVGFAFGAKWASIPLPGNPMLWTHFCYGMNPYSENNYSLYRADNWMNKAPHRNYLLNDLYEDYNTSQISIGLIWNLQ